MLENGKVRITFGRNGAIVELTDKTSGLTLSGSERGLGNPMRIGDYGDSWTRDSGPTNGSVKPGPIFRWKAASAGARMMPTASGLGLNRNSCVSIR